MSVEACYAGGEVRAVSTQHGVRTVGELLEAVHLELGLGCLVADYEFAYTDAAGKETQLHKVKSASLETVGVEGGRIEVVLSAQGVARVELASEGYEACDEAAVGVAVGQAVAREDLMMIELLTTAGAAGLKQTLRQQLRDAAKDLLRERVLFLVEDCGVDTKGVDVAAAIANRKRPRAEDADDQERDNDSAEEDKDDGLVRGDGLCKLTKANLLQQAKRRKIDNAWMKQHAGGKTLMGASKPGLLRAVEAWDKENN